MKNILDDTFYQQFNMDIRLNFRAIGKQFIHIGLYNSYFLLIQHWLYRGEYSKYSCLGKHPIKSDNFDICVTVVVGQRERQRERERERERGVRELVYIYEVYITFN